MPRKTDEEWMVPLIVGLIISVVTIFVSNLADTTKGLGALALLFVGYIVYNELTKRHSKSRSK